MLSVGTKSLNQRRACRSKWHLPHRRTLWALLSKLAKFFAAASLYHRSLKLPEAIPLPVWYMLPSWSCASPRLCSAASDEAKKACTRYYKLVTSSHVSLVISSHRRVPRESLVPRTHVKFHCGGYGPLLLRRRRSRRAPRARIPPARVRFP